MICPRIDYPLIIFLAVILFVCDSCGFLSLINMISMHLGIEATHGPAWRDFRDLL